MSEFIGAFSSTFIAYSQLSAEEQSNKSLYTVLNETFIKVAEDLSKISQHQQELVKLSSELEKQLTVNGPRFIIYPITTFVKHLNLVIGFDGDEVFQKSTTPEPFTYKVQKDKTLIFIPKLFFQTCANSSMCQALSILFEVLNPKDYQFVEVDALTDIPEDKSELAFATRMYVTEDGKLQGFIVSKANEKKLAKKNNSSPQINSLLVNLRAHVVETVLKASKFERKYQNIWYPFTWQKYVKDTLKSGNTKVITPLEQQLRSKVNNQKITDLYLFLVKDILLGNLSKQQQRLPWKQITLPAADIARQMQLKDKKKTYFSLIYNSKDPSNLQQKKEMDYVKPKTLEILTSATIQEKQAIVEIYKTINGDVKIPDFQDDLDQEERQEDNLYQAQFQLKSIEDIANLLNERAQMFAKFINTQTNITSEYVKTLFEGALGEINPLRLYVLNKLKEEKEALDQLLIKNQPEKAVTLIMEILKKFQTSLLKEIQELQQEIIELQKPIKKENIEQINSSSLKKEKMEEQPRDFWSNPTLENIRVSINQIEKSYKKLHDQQANKFKFVQTIVNKRLNLLEEKDKKRKDAFKVLQKKLEGQKMQGIVNQKSRDAYGIQKDVAVNAQIYTFTAIVLPALTQLLRTQVTFEEIFTVEKVKVKFLNDLVNLGLVLTADQIRLESNLITF